MLSSVFKKKEENKIQQNEREWKTVSFDIMYYVYVLFKFT